VNVAILGASHGGFTTAADLALAGHAVRLWARTAQALVPLAHDPTIVLTAEGRSGTARLARATTDLAEALAGAEIVIAPIPATGHDDLAKSLAPHVNERQIILLTPGTLGSYAIARALARAGARQPFSFAETGTLPYLTRRTGPAAVSAPVRAANLPLGVFPASRTKQTVARLADLFPAARPASTRSTRR
jgi:opine dehydrogenase